MPTCNGHLSRAAKGSVDPLLRPGTRRTYQVFSRCQSCGQVYWRGAHSKRLEQIIDSAARAVSNATGERSCSGMSERFRGTGRLREPGTRGATRGAQPDGCARPAARQGWLRVRKGRPWSWDRRVRAARLSWRRMRWEDQEAMSTDLTVILEHRPGELARLGEITGEAGVSIRGLAAFTGEGRGVVHVLLDDDAVARPGGP